MLFSKRRQAKKHAHEERDAAQANARRIEEVESLLDRAESGEEEAQDELVNRGWHSTDPVRKRRIAANALLVAVRRDFNFNCLEAIHAHAKWVQAVGTDHEISFLSAFLTAYRAVSTEQNISRLHSELGIRRKDVKRKLDDLIRERYEALVKDAEDVEKFKELWDLIRKTRSVSFYDSRGNWHYYNELYYASKLPYPENWNDLVALHFDTPDLSMFVRQPERGPGDVRLLAAEAIRTDDFTQAQIALAYCNNDAKYRAAVGDVLTAELAKLVMRHRAEMSQEVQPAE